MARERRKVLFPVESPQEPEQWLTNAQKRALAGMEGREHKPVRKHLPGQHDQSTHGRSRGDGTSQEKRSRLKKDWLKKNRAYERFESTKPEDWSSNQDIVDEWNRLFREKTDAYVALRDYEAELDKADPGWRSRGFKPNPKVEVKSSYFGHGDGHFHKIYIDGEKVGHIGGVPGYGDRLRTAKTIINPSARGQRAYQTALAHAALRYEGGTESRRYQMSTPIKRAIQKIPGIQWHEDRDAWILTPDAAREFLGDLAGDPELWQETRNRLRSQRRSLDSTPGMLEAKLRWKLAQKRQALAAIEGVDELESVAHEYARDVALIEHDLLEEVNRPKRKHLAGQHDQSTHGRKRGQEKTRGEVVAADERLDWKREATERIEMLDLDSRNRYGIVPDAE